jgi:RES domain-containing protein
MVTTWRLVREQHAADAFSGAGAARYGGRWNSQGRHLVYTSGSEALAALETLVHLIPRVHVPHAVFRVEIPEALIAIYDVSRLPSDWRAEPSTDSTRAIGDAWLDAGKTPVLQVPSLHVSSEFNYLLNPHHRDFAKLRIDKAMPFSFDPRLL